VGGDDPAADLQAGQGLGVRVGGQHRWGACRGALSAL
jgi:hypothetical protein